MAPKTQQTLAAPQTEDRYAEDRRLVEACARGETWAWATMLEKYEVTIHYAVLNTLRARGHEPTSDEVADIEADIVLALAKNNFRKLARYSGRCKLSHWLKVVSNNFTIDRLRQKRPSVSLDDDFAPAAKALRATLDTGEPTPREAFQKQQMLEKLRGLYTELAQGDRTFVELHVFEELSFEEIAQRMETTVGAVYARKNRVRKKLMTLAAERGLLA